MSEIKTLKSIIEFNKIIIRYLENEAEKWYNIANPKCNCCECNEKRGKTGHIYNENDVCCFCFKNKVD